MSCVMTRTMYDAELGHCIPIFQSILVHPTACCHDLFPLSRQFLPLSISIATHCPHLLRSFLLLIMLHDIPIHSMNQPTISHERLFSYCIPFFAFLGCDLWSSVCSNLAFFCPPLPRSSRKKKRCLVRLVFE